MVFIETTNYDFLLPNYICDRHLKTNAANVWNFVQCDQAPFQIKPCLSLLIFS